ncbi:SulP family inorganic anion transporter [Sphingobacterium spiritivorum]|uniref:Inorganic anion transporter, SulP family n=1 Tax=Sphingobacterium spiritivorum ATCC 33861 TaxID=525373 RepID=D7VL57_SPHSI|nr:SulP family inorganic anion transporter [Sphingobacterium spiritivorum]EFK58330.1 inorganic anion transporter, SulP family [Sphingobacterium spiritivorum ATCC 33861]QQT37079.1 SulP family inorganic anion transporter [Sphingobacterium spiritivorum]WQD33852.1 SulP family inorganic anion transporter [Sphingobacterium spiritivorum]SUJ27499.1 Putative sulfate transporter ychM [Sphingobacterium spiritivorum]
MFGTRMSAFLKLSKRDLKYDFPSSIVVFLVALPLCLGIAMASGAPLFAGILTGIIGGIVVASISKSPLSVSGPAAGLTVIVLGAIQQLGAYETFLLAVVIAGIIQLILGIVKAGMIGNYFPSSVIIGMLAAIGITIILKQIPLAMGLTEKHAFEMDNGGGVAAFADTLLDSINYGALIICLLSLAILIYWPKLPKVNKIPAPLLVVAVGLGLAMAFQGTSFQLSQAQLVTVPVVGSFSEFTGLFTLPDFSQIVNKEVWIVAFTIAIIASLETLLSIEAVDKIDPFKRNTPTNRELIAQGVGNMASGMLGGLPMTSVIVRSSANVNAGGRTRQSAMLHGLWLFIALLAIPTVLNMIPLSCLAAILLHTGYKLAKPALFKEMYVKGWDQFIPFFMTIAVVVFTDLLTGVGVGIVVATFYILKANMKNAFKFDIIKQDDNEKAVITLAEEVTFLNKVPIQQKLYSLPKNIDKIEINGSQSKFIDKDVIEVIKDFQQNAISKGRDIQLTDIVYKK